MSPALRKESPRSIPRFPDAKARARGYVVSGLLAKRIAPLALEIMKTITPA